MISSLRSLAWFVTSLLSATLFPTAHAAGDLTKDVSPVRSYTATVTAEKVSVPELQKISKDYANAYRLKTSRIAYLYPGHVKVDSSIGMLTALLVFNGNVKSIQYGPFRKRRDVTNAPGLKESLIDFGLLTRDALEDYTWKFLRTEPANGGAEVYELFYKNPKDTSRFLLWMDPVHKVALRRLIYHQLPDRSLKMDLRFGGLTLVGGVWVPTLVQVYNKEGKLGAESRQTQVRVDPKLSASDFKL